jgi:transposase InsO family protein
MAHARRRLSEYGRALLVERVRVEGWTAAAAAEAAGVSRATVYVWLRRWDAGGPKALADRSSRPHHSPHRLTAAAEASIIELRRTRKLGPHRLSALLGHPRSTCYAVLRRRHLHRLDWMDRPTGVIIRRYERERPGELVHVDVKKLARIPDGGGHRVYGRELRPPTGRTGGGYEYVHACVDDHSRMAYAEILPDEKGATCGAFLRRAADFFAVHNVHIERVLTDNAMAYRLSVEFRAMVEALGARQLFTRCRRPQTNGKVERFNRTLLEEWAYVRPYAGNQDRAALLPGWLHMYNHHRSHTALGGGSPFDRVKHLCGNYS